VLTAAHLSTQIISAHRGATISQPSARQALLSRAYSVSMGCALSRQGASGSNRETREAWPGIKSS